MVYFRDPTLGGLEFQFAMLVDFAPMAILRCGESLFTIGSYFTILTKVQATSTGNQVH